MESYDLKRATRSRVRLAARWHTAQYGRQVTFDSVCEAFAACGILIGRITKMRIEEHQRSYAETYSQVGGRTTGDPVQIADSAAIRAFFFVELDNTQAKAAKAMGMSLPTAQQEWEAARAMGMPPAATQQELEAGRSMRCMYFDNLAQRILKKASERYYIETV